MENIYENGNIPEEQTAQPAVEEQAAPAFEQEAPAFEQEVPAAEEQAPEQTAWEQPAPQKKAFPVKLIAILGGAIAALVALIIILCAMGNNYKTPIKEIESLLNQKKGEKIINQLPKVLNGFGEKEAKNILKILKKSDSWEDMSEQINDGWNEVVESLEEEYGSNYKIKIKVKDKEKLDKDDCKDFKSQLKSLYEYKDYLDEVDPDDLADEIEISKSQAKKILKYAETFLKDCKSPKVSAGYELELLITIDGKDAEEPLEQELTVNVYKVDGRWIVDVFSLISNFMFGGLGGLGGLDFGF